MKRKSRRVRNNDNIVYTLYKGDAGCSQDTLLILAHRDLDGLKSAFILSKALAGQYGKIAMTFIQPYNTRYTLNFLCTKVKFRMYTHVALVDISVDHSDPYGTVKLFQTLSPNLRFVFDHHVGWSDLWTTLSGVKDYNVVVEGKLVQLASSDKFIVIDEDEVSCAKIIYDHFGIQDQYLEDIVRIASIADDLRLRAESEGTDLYKLFSNIKSLSLDQVLKQLLSCSSVSGFSRSKTSNYDKDVRKASLVLNNAIEIRPGIGFVKTFADDNVAHTAIYEQAYKKYKVFIIRVLDTYRFKTVYIIGHILPNLDLTKVFELEGGNPRRIRLHRKDLTVENIADTINAYVSLG